MATATVTVTVTGTSTRGLTSSVGPGPGGAPGAGQCHSVSAALSAPEVAQAHCQATRPLPPFKSKWSLRLPRWPGSLSLTEAESPAVTLMTVALPKCGVCGHLVAANIDGSISGALSAVDLICPGTTLESAEFTCSIVTARRRRQENDLGHEWQVIRWAGPRRGGECLERPEVAAQLGYVEYPRCGCAVVREDIVDAVREARADAREGRLASPDRCVGRGEPPPPSYCRSRQKLVHVWRRHVHVTPMSVRQAVEVARENQRRPLPAGGVVVAHEDVLDLTPQLFKLGDGLACVWPARCAERHREMNGGDQHVAARGAMAQCGEDGALVAWEGDIFAKGAESHPPTAHEFKHVAPEKEADSVAHLATIVVSGPASYLHSISTL